MDLILEGLRDLKSEVKDVRTKQANMEERFEAAVAAGPSSSVRAATGTSATARASDFDDPKRKIARKIALEKLQAEVSARYAAPLYQAIVVLACRFPTGSRHSRYRHTTSSSVKYPRSRSGSTEDVQVSLANTPPCLRLKVSHGWQRGPWDSGSAMPGPVHDASGILSLFLES